MPPLIKHRLNSIGNVPQSREVPVMGCLASSQLPNSFNRVQFRTVGRHELKGKPLPALFSPGQVKICMMISDVVDNEHNSPPGTRTDRAQLLQKSKKRGRIEFVRLPAIDKFSVPDPDRTKIADAFSGRMVKYKGVFNLRRNPHSAPGPMLLEPDFIQGPYVYPSILPKLLQFFYMQPAAPGLPVQSWAVACVGESRVVETTSGIALHQGRPSIADE